MVGRRTSKRCDNCRRLKIKCDLSQPACCNCKIRKLVCPGYNTRFHSFHAKDLTTKTPKPSLPPAPVSEIDSLRSEYVHKQRHGQLTARFWMTHRGGEVKRTTFLDHIPQRLGESRALDDAVRCISRADPSGHRYFTAIRSLQIALEDPVRLQTSETLAAAFVLYIRDIYFFPTQRNWAVHADGLVGLLKARVVDSLYSDLDRQMVNDLSGTAWTFAIQDRKPSFLAEVGWNKLIGGPLVLTPKEIVDEASNDVVPSLLAINSHVPGLLCRYEQPQTDRTSASLIEDLTELRRHLLARFSSINDIDLSEDVYNGEEHPSTTTTAWEMVLEFTASAIIVLTGYMLANLLEEDSSANSAQVSVLEKQCRNAALIAKTAYSNIMSNDPFAAWACPLPLVLMLQRALKVSKQVDSSTEAIRSIAKDLCGWLLENCKGPEWPYALLES